MDDTADLCSPQILLYRNGWMMKRLLKAHWHKTGVFFLLIFVAGCGTNKVVSQWRHHEVVTNGLENEWKGAPQYYDSDRQLAIRVMNDEEALYICLSANEDRLKRMIALKGLTLWLDPEGGEKKTFGIRLPGKSRSPEQNKRSSGDHRSGSQNNQRKAKTDRGSRKPPELKMPRDMEIIYAGETAPLKMTIAQARDTGIEIGTGQPDGRIVCEFRIRFKAAACLTDLNPGMMLGIGCEVGTDSGKNMMEKKTGNGNRGAGRKGGKMGGPGGGGPREGKVRSRQRPEPLEVWMAVNLASYG